MPKSNLNYEAYMKDFKKGKLKEGNIAIYATGKLIFQSENPYKMVQRFSEAVLKEKSPDISVIYVSSNNHKNGIMP